MRKIKFRAWDKKEKKMKYQGDQKGQIIITFGRWFSLNPKGKEWEVQEDLGDGNWFGLMSEGLELMQCTGLKDKNGKEIYEGDIVFYKTRYGNSEHTESYWLEITYIAPSFEAKVTRLESNHQATHYIGQVGDTDLTDGRDDGLRFIDLIRDLEVEVIGNIYENKELLNGENG